MKTIRIFLTAGLILVLGLAVFSPEAAASDKKVAVINGAGASFPYPIYMQWSHKYEELYKIRLNYQSIGSGGGIAQIKAKTVDFGASDAPLKVEELKAAGLLQFPMVIGGVVPIFNLKGFIAGQIKLSAENLADMFLGKIRKWNDPEIVKNNPGVKLPDKTVTTVHRADGSGTTWIFTNYLSKISEEWKEKVSFSKAPRWPEANSIAGKGNEGVAVFVKKVDGAIGYVEYAYALQNKIPYVKLQNKAGRFVSPSLESFQAAAANADWNNAPGFYLVLTNQPGNNTWPISGASFILMYKNQNDADKAKSVLKFFDWCYKHGADLAEKLDYVPMPRTVIVLVESTWHKEMTAGNRPVW
ncbi:phosphate ABC transporter substrate-binding protein PstS [bacterium]|nr:phosphate ABC transporter substrate-binding protein PstS [bacterium]